MQISILIELSELIGFVHDLSDAKMDKVLEKWYLRSFLVTRIQESDPGPKGPLV